MQRNKCLHSLGGARGARNYLKFTALAASTIALVKVGNPLDVSLVTSLNGSPWQAYTIGNTISLNEGDELRWKASTYNNTLANGLSNYHNFVTTGNLSASGYLSSLIDGSVRVRTLQGNYLFVGLFANNTALSAAPMIGAERSHGEYQFARTFENCSALENVPAITITPDNYGFMQTFRGCTALRIVPTCKIELKKGVCYGTFEGCTSLEDASAIEISGEISPHEDMMEMFKNCGSLQFLPRLNAVDWSLIGQYSVLRMCVGCTSLEDASGISISANNVCVREMFNGCESLLYPPTISANGVVSYGFYSVFKNCKSLVNASAIQLYGSFEKNALEQAFDSCIHLTNQPKIEVSIADGQRTLMAAFRGCSELQVVTLDFPATLSSMWQSQMFLYTLQNCNALTDVTITWEEWPPTALVPNQFFWPNISGVTLHVKPTLDISNPSTYGIPASWTIVQDVV